MGLDAAVVGLRPPRTFRRMSTDNPRKSDCAMTAAGTDESRALSRPPSAGMYEQILEWAADAIVTINDAQDIVHFNRGAEEIFGYAKSEVLGRSLGFLLPPRFRGTHEGFVREFGESSEAARLMGHRREVFGLRKDGTDFPAEASILKLDAPDGRRLYTAVVRDVTDRKRMEQQQRFLAEVSAALGDTLEYEATLESVVRLPVTTLADACILDLLDESGKLKRLTCASTESAEAGALSETRRSIEPGSTVSPDQALAALERFTPTMDSPAAQIDALQSKRTELVAAITDDWLAAHCEDMAEVAAIRQLGARSLLIVPMIARGEPVGVLTLVALGTVRHVYDASDQLMAENFASRAALAIDNARLYRDAKRATSARDEVLGVVSHDLRNPLSTIAMCSRVLTDTPPTDPAARHELAKTIYDSTTWMSRMIQDLLDVSAIEAGVLSLMCATEQLEPIVRRATELFARAAVDRGVDIAVNVAGFIPAVHVDAERLMQAVTNLIGNAVKFTSRGGTVTVSACGHDNYVEVEVEDTGHGIAAADLPHVFDRYWHSRGSAAGTGLGLAITKGIVEAHGGRIEVSSTAGLGSRFSIQLPCAATRT